MPVRIKITLLFTLIVFIILSLLCGSVYYFSYHTRIQNIRQRLLNRAITSSNLLNQSELFQQGLINKIDASTSIAIKHKSVQAYDAADEMIYRYSDNVGDTIVIDTTWLDNARVNGHFFVDLDEKEVVAFSDTSHPTNRVIVTSGYDDEGRHNLDSLRWILYFSFAGGVVIALLTGYFFSKGLLLPIKRITDEVNIISAQNLAHRIKSGNSNDEWNGLVTTLNELLNRLQESFETQRRFVSNASHELSTPLTSIYSQLEITLQRERAAEEYRKVMLSVYQDVRHLSLLTQTLLEFAKASGTAGGLEIEMIRIDEVLLMLPGEVKKLNRLYHVNLSFESLPETDDQLVVPGNRALLFTAIKNIVVNACKYSNNHTADVKLAITGNIISITVKDKGKGIATEELENIFQPFYRSSNSRNVEGFGLGLSLAKRIINLHKGNIAVESQLNKGTVFLIELPSS